MDNRGKSNTGKENSGKRFQVLVRLKPGVLDVQGKAVERGLGTLGLENISNVRIGKLIELEVNSGEASQAKIEVETLCQKLLANPIIENYEIIG